MRRRRFIASVPVATILSGCSFVSEVGRIRTIYLDNEAGRTHELAVVIARDGETIRDESYELASSGAESSETVTGVRRGLADATVETRLLGTDAENAFSTSDVSGCHDLLVRVTRRGDVVFFTTPVDGCSE